MIKLYVLTGFLGSGKTTFLREQLMSSNDMKVGVIQNEFGKISIDGDTLRNDDITMVELNRGSIFCSCLKLNFVKAMEEMSKTDIDVLFVESSGLADPSNMGEILEAVEYVAPGSYEYKGAICLVDGLQFDELVDDEVIVTKQVLHSELAVISKSDLLDDDRKSAIAEGVRSMNPSIKIVYAEMGKIDDSIYEEDLLAYTFKESEDSLNTPENKPKTLMLTCKEELDADGFKAFLEALLPMTHRMKGTMNLGGKWMKVDVVGKKVDIIDDQESDASGQFVIISKIGPTIIRPIFDHWEANVGNEMKVR